ncbi:MAG: GPGG-motif small membrane protein [Aeromicrobium sp.]
MWETILWIAAVIIGVFGILRLVKGDILMGIVLIVVALLVGPGGVSLLS